jgi:hypothetical protein
MKLSLLALGVIGVSIATAGCLVLPPPQAGDPNAGSAAGSGGSDPTSAGPSSPGTPAVAANRGSAPATPSAPKTMIPTSLEVHSDCSKTVGVFLGEKPGFSSGTRSSVSSNSTTTFGRNADGSLKFWLLDDKDNGITSVAVSASTKRVTVDASCKSLSST